MLSKLYPVISVINIHGQLTIHCPNLVAPIQPQCQYPFISLYILSYPLTFKLGEKMHCSGIEPSIFCILTSRLDHYTMIVDINMSFLLVSSCQHRIQPTQPISGAGTVDSGSRCHCCDGPGAGAAAGQGACGGLTWGRGNRTEWLIPSMCRICKRRSDQAGRSGKSKEPKTRSSFQQDQCLA